MKQTNQWGLQGIDCDKQREWAWEPVLGVSETGISSGGKKDFTEEVMMWLNPEECVLKASWLSVWPVGNGNTFFKVHGTLK